MKPSFRIGRFSPLSSELAKKSNQRSDLQVVFHEQRVAQCYLQGMSQSAIAEEVDISPYMVKSALKNLRQQWQERALYDFSVAKAEELAKIDEVERTAWTNFHESVKARESITTMKTGDNPQTKIKNKSKGPTSDSKWLDTIKWCIDQRCKILGLYAPKQTIIDQTIHSKKNMDEMSTEELLAIANSQMIPAVYDVEEGVEIGTEPHEVDLTESQDDGSDPASGTGEGSTS